MAMTEEGLEQVDSLLKMLNAREQETPVKSEVKPRVKPGVKSTEFYMTLVSVLCGVASMTGVIDTNSSSEFAQTIQMVIQGLLIVVPTLGYSFSRAKAKGITSNE